jgi:hypothetical protein
MEVLSVMQLSSLFLLGAAFLVVAAMTWSATVAGWTAFGVSAGSTVIAATSAAVTQRTQRTIGHGLIALAANGPWSQPWPSAVRGSPGSSSPARSRWGRSPWPT